MQLNKCHLLAKFRDQTLMLTEWREAQSSLFE